MILADVARYVEKAGVLDNVVYDLEGCLVQPKTDTTTVVTNGAPSTDNVSSTAGNDSRCCSDVLKTELGPTAVLHKPLVKCRIPHLVFEATSESCNLRKVIQVCTDWYFSV